jgi:hypothetical protein
MVDEIAARLLAHGRFVIHLDTSRLQDAIDVGWAARQAGELLGQHVRITTSRAGSHDRSLVVTAFLGGPVSDDDAAEAHPDHHAGGPTHATTRPRLALMVG